MFIKLEFLFNLKNNTIKDYQGKRWK